MAEIQKVRPEARVYYNIGNDGKDGYFAVQYECSKCGKPLWEDSVSCPNCGTHFDWSKKAYIVVKREIEWR